MIRDKGDIKHRKQTMARILTCMFFVLSVSSAFSGCVSNHYTTPRSDKGNRIDNKTLPEYSQNNETPIKLSENNIDVLFSCNSNRINRTSAIYVNDFFSALVATPITIFYDVSGRQHIMPLVFDGTRKTHIEEFLRKYEKYELYGNDIEESSAKAALEFWNGSDIIMVIENSFNGYRLGVSAAIIASYLNIPIVCGTSNLEKVVKLLKPKYIIEVGNISTHLSSVQLKFQEEVQNLTILILGRKFGGVHYLTLTNPNDVDCSWGSEGASCLAPYLTAYRQGIICAASMDPLPKDYFGNDISPSKETNRSKAKQRNHEMKQNIVEIIHKINSSGLMESYLSTPYLCIFGDPYTVPFDYYFWKGDNPSEVEVCTDDNYANIDERTPVLELASGRITGDSCKSVGALILNTIFYHELLPLLVVNQIVSGSIWMNNCYISFGDDWNGAIFASSPYYLTSIEFFYEHDFNISTLAVVSGKTVSETFGYYLSSNFIYVMAHGSPENYQMIDEYKAEEIKRWNMGPSVLIMMACSVGRTDWNNFKNVLAVAFIEAGCVSYIGGSRDESVTQSPTINEYLIQTLVDKNNSVGISLMEAKNRWTNLGGGPEYRVGHSAIKILYGDPAFNPYEPCNEGST